MFDLTTNVTTRNGRPARVVSTKLDDEDYPIAALIQNDDGTEEMETYTREGGYSTGFPDHPKDLIKVPETVTRWVNLGYAHPTYEAAAAYHLAFPVLKVVREVGTDRLVSSEIAAA